MKQNFILIITINKSCKKTNYNSKIRLSNVHYLVVDHAPHIKNTHIKPPCLLRIFDISDCVNGNSHFLYKNK